MSKQSHINTAISKLNEKFGTSLTFAEFQILLSSIFEPKIYILADKPSYEKFDAQRTKRAIKTNSVIFECKKSKGIYTTTFYFAGIYKFTNKPKILTKDYFFSYSS